tara:strand:+ start:385 stop:765 length:381 start_codon:yes stop_codon:yes gene_type:complete
MKKYLDLGFIFCFISVLLFFSSFSKLYAEEIKWVEVANTGSEIQYIDVNSIKYNKSSLLSVMTKSSEINPVDQKIINTNSYFMAIDCENRLFSRIPVNGELKQIKNWENPIDNKLIKRTIVNSCSY